MIISDLRRRLAAVGALTVVLAFAGTATASAHVRVLPDSVAPGSFSQLTFRVPNESDTAGTVKLSVTLPTDKPFLYVSTKPITGWTATTSEQELPTPVVSYGTTLTKAVRTVTWTADRGVSVKPGEYQEFSISVGPLPDSGTILLPATQTYSDGTVVNWNEATPAGGDEPEHPAPEFTIQQSTGGQVQPAAATGTIDPIGRLVSGLALAVGVVAIAVTVLTRRRGRG